VHGNASLGNGDRHPFDLQRRSVTLSERCETERWSASGAFSRGRGWLPAESNAPWWSWLVTVR